jgi:hypothetical protein
MTKNRKGKISDLSEQNIQGGYKIPAKGNKRKKTTLKQEIKGNKLIQLKLWTGLEQQM